MPSSDPSILPTRIPRAEPVLDDSALTFSFKYLALEANPKFAIELCERDFFLALVTELHKWSGETVSAFCQYDNARHSHYIHFDETSEPSGFCLPEQLDPEWFWQFSVGGSHSWRVHGFFIDSTFYIVWLDPNHNLYGTSDSV